MRCTSRSTSAQPRRSISFRLESAAWMYWWAGRWAWSIRLVNAFTDGCRNPCSHSRRSACCCHTRSSTQKTFSCCGGTTSAPRSTGSTAFTMSASVGITSSFGRPLPITSTACLWLLLSTRRSSACTAASLPICRAWSRSVGSCVRLTCQILVRGDFACLLSCMHPIDSRILVSCFDLICVPFFLCDCSRSHPSLSQGFFATCCGLIQTRISRGGAKTIGVSLSPLAAKLCRNFCTNTIWT
jgi:hypothetical protein